MKIDSDRQRIREIGELLKVNLPASVLMVLGKERAELEARVLIYDRKQRTQEIQAKQSGSGIKA